MPVYFHNYVNTDWRSRNAVKNTVNEFLGKIGSNSAFINGYTFHIVDNYDDLSTQSPFTRHMKKYSDNYKYTGGASYPPEFNNGIREIVLKTEELDVPRKWFKEHKSKEYIEHATMHEIGHMFDNYYGKKDVSKLKKCLELPKIDEVEEYTESQQKIGNDYYRNKDLSDSKEFKTAWKSDIEKYYRNSNFLEKSRIKEYFLAFDIDVSDGLNDEEIEKADMLRSEDFAQLFGYAFGKDEGNKNTTLKMLPRTFMLIKTFIKKYLNVNC